MYSNAKSNKVEPSDLVKSLSSKGLVRVHNELHGLNLDSTTVTLHHIIVNEMRKRNMVHENVDCPIHKAVVLKSELLLSLEKAKSLLRSQPTSSGVHVDSIMPNRKKKKKKVLVDDDEIEKGDKPGHPFRGNQHSRGGGGGGANAASGTTEADAQQMASEQDNDEKISELEDKFSERQSQAEDEMLEIEDKVRMGIRDYEEEHRDEDGKNLDTYDDNSLDIASDARDEMKDFRERSQDIDFGDDKTVGQRQEQIDELEADWEKASDRLLEKFEQNDDQELDFSRQLDDFGGWVDEIVNLADSVNRKIGGLSG